MLEPGASRHHPPSAGASQAADPSQAAVTAGPILDVVAGPIQPAAAGPNQVEAGDPKVAPRPRRWPISAISIRSISLA